MKSCRMMLMLAALVLVGCAAPIELTQPLTDSPEGYNALIMPPLQNDVVGEINQQVCNEIMVNAAHGMINRNLFPYFHFGIETGFASMDAGALYEVRAAKVVAASIPLDSLEYVAARAVELYVTLLEYKKGNSLLRFLLGNLAGGGHVIMRLQLIDHKDRHIILAGTTKAKIQGSVASEQDVIGPLSKAITKFVENKFLRGAGAS